jgi:hypothetical protein
MCICIARYWRSIAPGSDALSDGTKKTRSLGPESKLTYVVCFLIAAWILPQFDVLTCQSFDISGIIYEACSTGACAHIDADVVLRHIGQRLHSFRESPPSVCTARHRHTVAWSTRNRYLPDHKGIYPLPHPTTEANTAARPVCTLQISKCARLRCTGKCSEIQAPLHRFICASGRMT